VRFTVGPFVAVVAILLVGTGPTSVVVSAAEIPFTILFDFGDGSFVWSPAVISFVNETNTTWDAIRRAAQTASIPIETTWYPSFGVAILDIGNRHSPAGFIGIYLWNRTSHRWEPTDKGVSTLVIQPGDYLALYNAAYDSLDFTARLPVPTPDHPRPSLMFRGDASNSGIAASSAPETSRVRWDRDTEVREIASTPAVANGSLYVTTMRRLLAIEATTGVVRWANPQVPGFSSPAVFDGSVFVGSSDGSVYRLKASDGQVQWATPLLAQSAFSGITSSPKVVFDWVFIGTFDEYGGAGEVLSLWASNGTVRWRHPTGSVHYSSPAYADGVVYVGVMGFYNTTSRITFDPPYGVLALDAATGHERWFHPTAGSVAASVAVAPHTILAPAKDGYLYALDRENGTEAWKSAVGAGVSSPAVWGNTVFVGGGTFGLGGRVTALDLTTGSERWSFMPNGPVQASLTYAGGTIVFATNTANGTLYALDATNGKVRWQFSPSPAEYILASPVVADGIVYAASDNGHVYAIEQVPPASIIDALGTFAVPIVLIALSLVAIVAAFVVLRRRRGAP